MALIHARQSLPERSVQEELSDVTGVRFDFEDFVKFEMKINLDARRDKNQTGEVCRYFILGRCRLGDKCPNRHATGKSVVCKHWLRGLCKKGDDCEFLHEYNLKKMPECWFFTKYGECTNSECQYLHIDPNSKVKDCPWYNRGFCKHGPKCRNKHVRKPLCQCYITGFCPKGPDCPFGHPKYELQETMEPGKVWKPLDEVVCFHCGEKGHFANKCPKRQPGFNRLAGQQQKPFAAFAIQTFESGR
ncbi:hypothetical protein M427DRAFT_113242 [Gonapodya prolifera JEL478]|uniref:mRNA 3'-end-processing protein n=1 Tax=Gonapodya prolifera (strain JEL478) TaxID=1344416 RepID=A0A139AA69_GONPJ|nr:hypothetical protein M427DRAFT_113242 [Gonapodya prolifera JEL478]|eukprot:KXS13686.1 hypothetical protein M427DRAFT_113242 [Gonapodya prolifera JEL478]